MKNFIPINRKLFSHYFWEEKRTYSKFEAWLDILQTVSFKDNNKNLIHGVLCKWNKGQFPISIIFLCNRWNWREKKVRNFLKLLENDKMITLKKEVKWTMLTVCKYDSYNKVGQSKESGEGNQRAGRGQELKNVNNINKDKEVALKYWLDYRAGIKKPVTNEKTLETLISKFNNTSIEMLRAVIGYTVENGYQGLFWDKFTEKDLKSISHNETDQERAERLLKERQND